MRGDTRNVWDGGQQDGEDGWPQLPSRETDVGGSMASSRVQPQRGVGCTLEGILVDDGNSDFCGSPLHWFWGQW